jgi:hypothetical protein
MYRRQTEIVVIVGLVLSIACGCWQGAMTATKRDLASRSLLPQMPVKLAVESLVLTCPSKDKGEYDTIWQAARAAGTPESLALWSENGLRIGVLHSPLPPRLQDWLDDETAISSGSLQTFHQRHETFLATTPLIEKCRLRLSTDLAAPAVEKEWEQIVGGIWVQPRLHKRGALLICEPRLQHDERQSWIRPAPDASRFVRSEEPWMERFPTLQVEVELTSEEYLIIGTHADATANLGSLLFSSSAPPPMSSPAVAIPTSLRLLLIRVQIPATASHVDLPEIPPPYLRR